MTPLWTLHAGATYRSDTRQLVFSVAKAVSAVAAHLAAERGELDLDQPIAEYWPAFNRPATASITCRTVLAHRAGLPAVDRPFDPYSDRGRRTGASAGTSGALLGTRNRARLPHDHIRDSARWHLQPHPRRHRRRVHPSPRRPTRARLSFGVPAVTGDIRPVLSRGAIAAEQPTGPVRHGCLKLPGSACSTRLRSSTTCRCVPSRFPRSVSWREHGTWLDYSLPPAAR